MTDQEMIDFIVQERINEVLARVEETENEELRIHAAEEIISNLPEDERKAIEYYINDFTNNMASKEQMLYKNGVRDGINLMKRLINL